MVSAAPLATLSPSLEAPRSFKVVVIGTSAGGVRALLALLAPLPATFRLPIVVVIHLPADRESKLSELFGDRLAIPVRVAEDKEPVEPANVYFAGPGYHLSLEKDHTFSLSGEEPVNYSRPSIDVVMESAADAYGTAMVGILLTGANADGAAGLARIKRQGGLTVVQSPAEAEVPTMPDSAIRKSKPDHILTLDAIHKLLLKIDGQSK